MFIRVLKSLKSKSENVDLAIAIIDDWEFDNEQIDENIRNYLRTLK